MESKEEISDTDSGIILQSGPDSPTSPIKDLTTHTRAMKLKHKSLEDRLELCLLELKKLCIREAELTGELSSDYPLLPGEKLPRIRRRIGAAFKLDEESIWQDGGDPELHSLEADLALQLQIFEAARRLAHEEHLSKQVRRSRQQQSRREERKVKELQEAVGQLRLRHGRDSPALQHASSQRDPGISDDSSLSDAVTLDEDVESNQSSRPASETPVISDPQKPSEEAPQVLHPSPQHAPPQTLEGLRPGEDPGLGSERSPIQNSPWRESSLDQPYQKPRKPHSRSSSRSSPAVTPVSTPVDPRFGDAPIPFPLASIKSLPLHHAHSNSAPSTPELHTRRQYSQSFRIPNKSLHDPDQNRGRAQLPRRRLTDFTATSPQYSPLRPGQGNPVYLSSSEDSHSEHSVPSYAGSPLREAPAKPSKPCPPPYGYHISKHSRSGPLAFTGPSFYRVPQHQSTPSFYRVCAVDDGIGCLPEIEMGRVYLGPPLAPPPFPGPPPARRERWPEEAPPPLRVLRALPPQSRLARAPSLREYPHHPSLGLPRELVSEELKSWHQRSQVRGPRPRSLDRQGAVRLRNATGRDSPLSLQHHFPQQFPQRRVLQRAPDGTPVQWYVEEDSEIISQV
ncbi:innate immunity activator b isoform X2 [Conger conger]|uniref:innate immunity activator b isoform X2 n=1 Tax=Conger conger TaxID=82655 RepID=UPI002A5A9466|nr:innate immunity activator b isoform X2 [Conger conger]